MKLKEKGEAAINQKIRRKQSGEWRKVSMVRKEKYREPA